MRYLQNPKDLGGVERTVLTLGKFDGVHRGHRLLIDEVKARAGKEACALLFTFDVSPQSKLAKQPPKSLLTNAERRALLARCGLDALLECPFTEELRRMEAEDFVREILCETLRATCIVMGEDFRFGRDRAGDAALIARLAERYGYEACIFGKLRDEKTGEEISSSLIRERLRAGEMEVVTRMLGAPYFVQGEIVRGEQRGRTIGIPTINLIPPAEKLLPPFGVYASKSEIGERCFDSITNIGTRPTVEGSGITVETHLFDAEEDFYGSPARVMLTHFLRPEQKFADLGALRAQMEADITQVKQITEH